MVTLSQSQTMPINPSSASPPLTHPEIWRALHLKCRQPELFVASITSSAVIQETPTFMKRSVTLREGMGPPGGKAVEELQIRAPWKVDFYNLDSGGFINNTISRGTDEMDLYLTFYFEWPFPDMEAGSEEEREMEERLWAQARGVVQHTIDHAREMKRDGKLGEE